MADTPSLPKRGLGKGLNALIKTPTNKSNVAPPPQAAGTAVPPAPKIEGKQILEVTLDQIVPSPFQPRKRFNEENLNELAQSIKEHGLIQPLVVRPVNGKFELIAGERRWRACTLLQLEKVPIVTKDAEDGDVLEMALIENLQREDLDPIEEAEAYNRLAVEFGLTQDEIGKRVSKGRATVANSMRLLDLDRDVQLLVSQKHISAGHAKALLAIKNRPEQKMLADIIVRKKMNVRDTEAMVQEHTHGKSSTKKSTDGGKPPEKEDKYLKFVEDKLREQFATNVVLKHGDKKGKIEIEYYGNENLSRVLEVMGVNLD